MLSGSSLQLKSCFAADGAVAMDVDGGAASPAANGAAAGGAARMMAVSAAQDLLRDLGSLHWPLRLMAAAQVVPALRQAAKQQVWHPQQPAMLSPSALCS